MPAFKSGRVGVQDEGSQIAAALVGGRPGQLVVDYCAGAGGKALSIAADMANKGRLILYDVPKSRLHRAAVGRRHSGVSNADRRVPEDGAQPANGRAGQSPPVAVAAPRPDPPPPGP